MPRNGKEEERAMQLHGKRNIKKRGGSNVDIGICCRAKKEKGRSKWPRSFVVEDRRA